jgi:hypothetical protein
VHYTASALQVLNLDFHWPLTLDKFIFLCGGAVFLREYPLFVPVDGCSFSATRLGVLTAEVVLAGGHFVLCFTDAVRAALVQFNFVRFPKSSASSE